MKRRASRGLTAALSALLWLAAGPSRAEAPAQESEATARDAYNSGVAAAKQNRWEDAHAALSSAWKLKQHWQIALNLGKAELELGKHRDAAEHLSFVLHAAGPDEVSRRLATQWYEKAVTHLGQLRIEASPAGARVLVDGVLVGDAPIAAPVLLIPGPHVVEVRSGAEQGSEQVTVVAQKTLDVQVSVGKTGNSAAGLTPARIAVLAVGGGLTFISAGIGLGTTVASVQRANEAQSLREKLPAGACEGASQPAECQSLRDKVAAQNRLGAAAVASFAGAGVTLGVTLGIMLWTARAKPPAPAAQWLVMPVAGAHGGGLWLERAF